MYHKTADAMSARPRMASKVKNEYADVPDDVSTYCIVEQTSELNDAPKPNREESEPLTVTLEMRKIKAKDIQSLNFNEVLKKDGAINVNEDGPLCRKSYLMGQYKLLCQNATKDQYSIMAITQYLLDI